MIVVDEDSPDRTWAVAQELGAADPRIRCYRRTDRKGLSSAVVDGLNLAVGDRLVVMDADLQHDPAVVPLLVAALDRAPAAVATRYAAGGGTGAWSRRRAWLSRTATAMTRLVLGIRTSDPMSGFFALRRADYLAVAGALDPRGYKILMEILHVMRPGTVAEVPYTFAPRTAGESKLSGAVLWDFAMSLAELGSRRLVSARFIKYALVGGSGVAIQYGTFALCWSPLFGDEGGLAAAIATAAVSNYVINNLWTFADRRHRGLSLLSGLFAFLAISGTGALLNQATTWYIHAHHGIAITLAMAVGIVVATVWNYHLNRDLTWGLHARPA
jgi:dolichol-phosphate mannosyltransferase